MFALRQAAFTVATLLLILPDCLAQFTELDGVNDDTYSVHYSSNGVIWIGGDSKTWKSTNYGATFTQTSIGATTTNGSTVYGTVDGIYGLSATQAFITGYFFLPNTAYIFKTNTGDSNWQVAYSDNNNFTPDRWTSDIDKDGGNQMIAVGSQGRIISSSDNGSNWSLVSSGTTNDLLNVEHISGSNWLVSGGNFLKRSTNNGAAWSDVTFPGTFCPLISTGGATVFAGGDQNLYKSIDNGQTWTSLPELPFEMLSLYALSATKLIASGGNDMFVSYNSGNTWERFHVNGYVGVTHMSFYDAVNGVATGPNGYVLKTTNGGGPSYPIANFSYESTFGCVDSIFHFTNETSGVYTYQWKVNGATVATTQDLDYAFPTAGTYTVTLVATNGNGNDEKSITVTTYPVPTFTIPQISTPLETLCPSANFTMTIQNPVVGVSYQAINNGVTLSTVYYPASSAPINITLQANSIAQGSSYHTFGVRAYLTNSCTTHNEFVYDSLLIVRPSPTVELQAPHDTICTGDHQIPIVFQVIHSEQTFSYNWTTTASPSSSWVAGNGDTLVHTYGYVTYGNHTYHLHVKNNSLGCIYPNIDQMNILGIDESDEQPFSASHIYVGESISFTNDMGYTQYTWDFTQLSNAPVSHEMQPPPFTYNVAGRDTVTFYGQVDESDACHVTIKQIVDVIDPTEFGSYSTCATGQYELGKMTDYYLDEANIGYSLSTKTVNGSTMIRIQKYDPAGHLMLQVEQPIGSQNLLTTKGIVADSSGNIYITFSTSGALVNLWDFPTTLKNCLVKLNSSGEFIWMVQSDNGFWDKPILANDKIVLSGITNASISIIQSDGSVFSSPTETNNPAGGNGFIFTFDSNGMLQQQSRFGMSVNIGPVYSSIDTVAFYNDATNPLNMCLASDGNILVSGLMQPRAQNETVIMNNVIMQGELFSNSSQITLNQVYTIRYNTEQGIVSSFSPAIGNITQLYDVTCLSTGNIVYSGTSSYKFLTSEQNINLRYFNIAWSNPGDKLFYLQCTDSIGQSQWEHFNQLTAYNHLDNYGNGEFAALGGYAQTGTWFGNDNHPYGSNSSGLSDCVCVTYNEDGSMTNAINIASPGSDLPMGLQMDACENARVFYSTNVNGYNFPFTGTWNSETATTFEVYDLGDCSPECIASSDQLYHDVAIAAIQLNTTDPFASSTRDISVALNNLSGEAIESVSIVCELDGLVADTLTINTLLPADSSISNIPLLTHTFDNQIAHRIKLWIHSIGSVEDNYLSNDTLVYQFNIFNGPLNGIYTIGANAADFSTISLAAQAIDTSGVSGPVEFHIQNGTYAEAITIRPGNGMSETNTVTFMAEPGAEVILTRPLYNGAAHITMENNSNYYIIKNLKFIRTDDSFSQTFIKLNSNCSEITVENCQFFSDATHPDLFLSISQLSARVQIKNNLFDYGAYAIKCGVPTGFNSNKSLLLDISNNIFNSQKWRSLQLFQTDSLNVDANQFIGTPPSQACVVFAYGKENFKFINNQMAFNNVLIDQSSSGTLSSGPLGKQYYFYNDIAVSGTRSLIANNIISKGVQYSPASFYLYGCENIDIVHNTFSCDIEVKNSSNITIYNNVITAAHLNYFLDLDASSVSACDYNVFTLQFDPTAYAPNSFNYCTSSCNSTSSITNWRTLSGFDIHSTFDTLSFYSDSDLHLLEPTYTGLASAAALMPFDVDNQPRNLINPTIGADEPMDIPLLVHLDNLVHPTCAQPGGQIAVSAYGGQGPYTYLWNDGSTSNVRDNLLPGTYVVTITDFNLEQTSDTIALNGFGEIAVDIELHTYCNELIGSLTTSTSGNYAGYLTYLWNDGNTNANRTITNNGDYYLTVTDINGCTATSDTITANLGTFTISPDTLFQSNCTGGNIYVNTNYPIGDVYYLWDIGESNDEDFTNAQPGDHQLIAINGNGCVYVYNTNLPDQMEVTVTNLTPCFNGSNGSLSIELNNAIDPIQISWSNGDTTYQSDNLGFGEHTVSVTDGSGCTIEESFSYTITAACGCTGDVDNDGVIGISDLLNIMSSFGCIGNCVGDLNEDYSVGAADIIIFMQLLGTSCE